MSRFIPALLASTILIPPALAAPKQTIDQNLRVEAYNPGKRYVVVGTIKRSLTVTVCPGESIVRVPFGDDQVIQGPDMGKDGGANVPIDNVVPLWPEKVGRTNFQILTKEPGKQYKTYQLSIEVRNPPADGADDPEAVYGLTFTCPDKERARVSAETAERAAKWAAVRQQREAKFQLAAAKTQMQTDFADRQRNYRYVARGSYDLIPSEVSDDGQQTGFRFPGNRQIPAVYAVGFDGAEQIVPFTMQSDLILVQRVARQFRLRLGGSVLEVFNLGYNPAGSPDPGTGTTSPNVVRTLRQASVE
jgi:type IV secretion system protein VirB9